MTRKISDSIKDPCVVLENGPFKGELNIYPWCWNHECEERAEFNAAAEKLLSEKRPNIDTLRKAREVLFSSFGLHNFWWATDNNNSFFQGKRGIDVISVPEYRRLYFACLRRNSRLIVHKVFNEIDPDLFAKKWSHQPSNPIEDIKRHRNSLMG